jgi:hypothetical protein
MGQLQCIVAGGRHRPEEGVRAVSKGISSGLVKHSRSFSHPPVLGPGQDFGPGV